MIALFLLQVLEIFSLNVTMLEVDITGGCSYNLPLNGILGRSVLLSKYNLPSENESSAFPIHHGEDVLGLIQYKLQSSQGECKEEIYFHLEENFFNSGIHFLPSERITFNINRDNEYEFRTPILENCYNDELKVLNAGIDIQINRLITDKIFPRICLETSFSSQHEPLENIVTPLQKTCSLIVKELQKENNSKFFKMLRSGKYIMTFFDSNLETLVEFFNDLNDCVLDSNFVSVINKLAASLFVSSNISSFLEERGVTAYEEQKKYAKWLLLMDFNNILNLYEDSDYKFKITNFNRKVYNVVGIPHFRFKLSGTGFCSESLTITNEEGKSIPSLDIVNDSDFTYLYVKCEDLLNLDNTVIKICAAKRGRFYESKSIELKFQ